MPENGTLDKRGKNEAHDAAPREGQAREEPRRHQGDGIACRTRCSSSTSATRRSPIHEAKKLGIPVVAVVDTNYAPDGVDYVIPGNDDAMRAIAAVCRRHRRRGARRHVAGPGGRRRARTSSSSSTRTAIRARRARARAPPKAPPPQRRPSPGQHRARAVVRWWQASLPIRKTVPIRPCSWTRAKRLRAAPRPAPAARAPARGNAPGRGRGGGGGGPRRG